MIPKHKHPHGVENTPESLYRIWVCEECNRTFQDDEARKDCAQGKWGHSCKAKAYKRETRCESHLEPYTPDLDVLK